MEPGPVREAVIEVVAGPVDAPEAVIARNQYGALVLSTARMGFIDVDVAPSTFPDAIGRLFGRPPPRAAILARIREGLAAKGWAMTFRLYETAAGFRVVVVDRQLDPSGPDAAALMDAVGADAAYKALCRGQHSFRARLTPKSWRCGLIASASATNLFNLFNLFNPFRGASVMKKLVLALTVVACGAAGLTAQQDRPKLPGEDWVQLFNGTDLTGWTPVGKEQWTVENGVIQGMTLTDGYGYLKTDKPYKDFHLSLKFLCVGTGNSGVFFHTDFKPGTADVSQGLQFEVDCRIGQHTGGIYGDGRQWVVWPAPENETVVRKDEWNEYLLIVEGNRYISRLNGVPMVDFTDPRPRSFDGAIALQLHSGGSGHMQFKDIWLRDLSRR
jgi:hypothetical protein